MLSDEEIDVLLHNADNALDESNDAYIYMYDFITHDCNRKKDVHNENFYVYKRNLAFYLRKLENYTLIDFRLWDNRKLEQYLFNDNISMIDTGIDVDDHNYTFSALFKRKS
jgi:hypothetical protein